MICPNCGSNVPDGSAVCPACRADLGMTVSMPRQEGRWCPNCGALVGEGDEVCPSCGMPQEPACGDGARAADGCVPREACGEESPLGETHSIPRIESAIPSEEELALPSAQMDRLPRLRVLVLAVACALVVVGGGVVLITHPWDPAANDIRAKEDADTSMAGFPGLVKQLQGQDAGSGSASDAIESGDERTLRLLGDVWGQLGELSERLDQSQDELVSGYASSSSDELLAGKARADQLSIDISNLISSLSEIDVTSGTYAEDKQNLTTLGNWLRNRMDAVSAGWAKAVSFQDPSQHADEILSTVSADGGSPAESFKALFDQGYAQWEPKERSSRP